jgi:NAD(P)-dependent dehydrogenase (short-subunit alcohol dehydrogenase family)
MSINLGGMVRCSRLAIPVLRERGGGSIVHIGSVLSYRGLHDAHAYNVAKGAILQLSRSIAVTYAKEGIRSNVVAPGFIETPLVPQEGIDLLNSEDYRYQWNPMGRMGKPEEITWGVLFFASDQSTYCTGSELLIDGGTMAKYL